MSETKPLFSGAPQPAAATTQPKPPAGSRAFFVPKGPKSPNRLFEDAAQRIVDTHLQAIMGELEAIGIKPLGIVSGVLNDGETSVNWCVSEDVRDTGGESLTPDEVMVEIARDIGNSSRVP